MQLSVIVVLGVLAFDISFRLACMSELQDERDDDGLIA